MKLSIFCLLFCISFGTINAQNYLLQTLPDTTGLVGIQYQRPVFKDDQDLSTFAGIYSLYTNLLLSNNFSITVDLPIIGYSTEDDISNEGIGNIFIGGQYHNFPGSRYKSVITFGVFLPTVEDDKYMMQTFGAMTNPYEINKYMGNRFSLYANYAYYNQPTRDFSFCVEAGPDISFLNDDVYDKSIEFLIHLGGRAALKINGMTISSEYQGLLDLTEDNVNFDDRMVHTLLFGGQWNRGWFRPKGFYKFYLNKSLCDTFHGVIGVGIDIRF